MTINKPIILQGEDKSTTIIDGSGYGNVIFLDNTDGVIISDITAKNGQTGICLPGSTYNTLKNIIVSDNTEHGINLGDWGLYGDGAHHNTLENIEAYSNQCGIIAYAGSNYLTIKNSNIHDNSDCGILVGWSYYLTIENTVSHSNWRGIGIDWDSYGTVKNCRIYDNTGEGIIIWGGTQGNNVMENQIYDNKEGIRILEYAYHYNDIFFHNDIKNEKNIIIEGNWVSIWNKDYPIGGNFYSDYTGSDQLSGPDQNVAGSDGIGDSAYNIINSNIDRYPLMKPWHSDFPYQPPATNQPPVAEAGESYQVNEGSPVTFDASSSSDPDGDTLQYRWDFGDGTTASDMLNPTHVYADNGVYTATLTVTDEDGGVGTDTLTITVNNVNPSVGEMKAPIDPTSLNTPITTSCTFTDAGLEDAHTGIWNWGDGTSSAGFVNEENGAGTITGEHFYADPGVYWVTLTVTDDDGGSSSVTTGNYVVIYNPEGGFVTGGGWINSPENAYAANPDLIGKATFGFVSKYEKGATVPTGKTEFQFKVADLNFKSTNYDWLVVAGSKAKYKGTGTINGEGNYGFMLSAVDGDTIDKFRINIWDKDNDNITVYDNEVNSGINIEEDVEPSTVIGGGSIVIHKEK